MSIILPTEEDDDKDPDEDPVDYPADGGDDSDDEDDSSEDDEDDDEVDIKADYDEEEEEHPAPADSAIVALPAADQTDESAATPLPYPAYRVTARISIPDPVPTPVWYRSWPTYEVRESSSAARPTGGLRADYGFVATMDRKIRRDLERDVGYGITDSWDEIVKAMQGTPVVIDVMELSQRMTEFETRVRRDTDEVMSLRTTVLAQQSHIRELQSADRRRQTVITEMLAVDHRRQKQITEALKLIKRLQT
ncbi:hypothetical protein Tco_0352742 [Tanacetum coccineum]